MSTTNDNILDLATDIVEQEFLEKTKSVSSSKLPKVSSESVVTSESASTSKRPKVSSGYPRGKLARIGPQDVLDLPMDIVEQEFL